MAASCVRSNTLRSSLAEPREGQFDPATDAVKLLLPLKSTTPLFCTYVRVCAAVTAAMRDTQQSSSPYPYDYIIPTVI